MASAEERSLRGRIGAHALHAKYDSAEIARHAREAFEAKFLEAADPFGELDLAERQRRADHLRREHMARLSLKAVQARRQRAEQLGEAG